MQKKAKYGMNLSIQHHMYSNTSKDFSLKDYYPFGMVMPERNYQANIYNYGYNGKPKDDEFHNVIGTFYDYGFRVYDSRLCRFLSVDLLTKDYPSLTSYQFASNRPIDGVDLDGLEYLYYALDFVDGNLVYKYLGTQKERIVTARALGLIPIEVPVWLPKRFVLQLNESGPHYRFSSFNEMNDAVMSGKSLDMNQTLEADIQFENDLQYVTGTIGAAMVSYMASGLGAKETSVSARNRTLLEKGLISEEIATTSKYSYAATRPTSIFEGAVKINYGRFVKSMPANAKSNASWKLLDDGNYLFEATSPASNIPGSKAVYQKWVNAQGETFKMLKTTYASDGSIVHIKSKF